MKKFFKTMFTMVLALAMVFTAAMPAMADEAAAAAKLTASQVKATTPTGVKAASYSYSKIKVTWNKIDGVDGYVVYRATTRNGTYMKAYSTSDPDKLYYINTGRTTGKTYYYKIRGYRKINGKTYYTKYSAVTYTYARPSKVKLTEAYGCPYSLVDITVDWQPISGATGYEQQVNVKRNGVWTGWKSVYYDEDGDKYAFKTYDSLLAITKKQFPTGKVTTKVNGEWKEISVEEYTAMSIGKTQARLEIVQDESIYKFRVRAYRTVNGKKIYGAWSDEYTMKETLNMEEIMAELKAYTIEYAAKVLPTFEYEEDTEGQTPENSSYYVDGVLGYCSMYARKEDVIAHYQGCIKLYIDRLISLGGEELGFLYARKSKPGDAEGVDTHLSSHTYYKFWMLY